MDYDKWIKYLYKVDRVYCSDNFLFVVCIVVLVQYILHIVTV